MDNLLCYCLIASWWRIHQLHLTLKLMFSFLCFYVWFFSCWWCRRLVFVPLIVEMIILEFLQLCYAFRLHRITENITLLLFPCTLLLGVNAEILSFFSPSVAACLDDYPQRLCSSSMINKYLHLLQLNYIFYSSLFLDLRNYCSHCLQILLEHALELLHY